MRILYLCADPGVPVLGRKGCSTHVREVARALQRAGHPVQILCVNRGEDKQRGDGLDIREVPPIESRWLGFDLRLALHNWRFERMALRLAREFRPDAIYERFSLYSMIGRRIEKRLGIPRLLEINAFLSHEQRERLHFPRLARWADRRVASSASHVVVVSEPLRDEVASLGISRSRIHKMPMTVDANIFTPETSGDEVRRRFGLGGKFVIGYMGTLTGWHGINLLYEVAGVLDRRLDNFVFLIVGGEDKKVEQHREKARQANLEKRFIFAGSIPHESVPQHLRAMDAALIPDTTYWSSPTKLFEYQASGLPIVAPRYAAILEAMEDGKEGLLFDAQNVEQFADCLVRLANDPEKRKSMGLHARERVLEGHSIDQQVARVAALLEQMRREMDEESV